MSRHSRKYKIMLTNEERNQLKEVLRSTPSRNAARFCWHWIAIPIPTPRIATVRITSACR